MENEHDSRLAEFEAWRKSWVRRAIAGYTLIVVAIAVGLFIIADTAQESNSLSHTVEDRSKDFCQAVTVNREAADRNAELANDGLRSISPNVPPSRATQDVIKDRQELRRELEIINCTDYFNGD